MNKPLPKCRLHLLNVFLGLFLIPDIYCQNFYVGTGETNFTCNSTSTLENAQVNASAFGFAVYSRYSFSVYAKVSGVSSSSGVAMPASMLAIKLNSVSPARSANYNTITMSFNNQRIVQGAGTGSDYVTYVYDLILGPVGYAYAPGSQVFTILLTLTSP